MENTNVLVAGENIKGDITNCKIEKQEIKVTRKSVYSLSENSTYISYDVCNKQIIEQYEVPHLTVFGFILLFFISCLTIIIVSKLLFN